MCLCRQEKSVILSELKAVKQDFEEWKLHEQTVKMSLQGLVTKFQNRCAYLQAEILENGKDAGGKAAQSPSMWQEEKRSLVNHNRVVKAQMQERIDRLTGLLVAERKARQNAYDANVKAMKKLEQLAILDRNPKGVALQMDQYIADLHQEMEGLRDTVILLQNDNAELVNERNHLRGQRQQMVLSHAKGLKEQERVFLMDVKSKNLEIERLRAQMRDLTAEKSKLKAAAEQATGRGGDWKAVLEKDVESLTKRLDESMRWKGISDDTILSLQLRLDAAGSGSSVDLAQQLSEAQGLVMDLESKIAIQSELLDKERKKVTELESAMYDLTLSTKTLHVFMDRDVGSKEEALKWHEKDQARIEELEAKLSVLNGSMNHVEKDLGNALVSTRALEEQHRMAVRDLEQEIELLRRRCAEKDSRSSVVVQRGNANALIELQSAMESASERSLYFESREAMLVQDKKYLQNQLDLLMEEKMGLEKAQELLLRENAHLKKNQQETNGLRKHEKEAEKDQRLQEATRKIDLLEVKLKEAEADNEKKHRDLNTLRDRLLLLDRMKQNTDKSLEQERANGINVAILSDMLKECEHTNRNLEAQLKLANDELQQARTGLSSKCTELREANVAKCKAEEVGNELKKENSSLGLELFKSRKEAREQGEEVHKVHRRNKDLERENEELQKLVNHMVIQSTQHEGETQAAENAKLAKYVAKIEAELNSLKKDYHEKVLILEDAQLALEQAESARKFSHTKLVEMEATTKGMAQFFRECKDKIETELKQAENQSEQSNEKLSDMTRKQQALASAHHKDMAAIEELRANARKLEFDYEVTSEQLEQTSQRLADALDRNSALQVATMKLEDENKVLSADLEKCELQLNEALRIQEELEKNIEEEKVGSIGSTNIAWQKLEKVAGEKAAADREIEALKLELEQSLEIQEKVQLLARESERVWAQNCREMEGRLEKLEKERRELRGAIDETKDAKREDDDTIDAIATELQNCRKHARDMELQKESVVLEMQDFIELSKRLTEEVDEVKRQCDLRDIKIDQLVLELDEKDDELVKVRASFKSMGEVAQNQQAQITLLQAEREKDMERLRELADEELMEANQQIGELKRELQNLHRQVQSSLSTKSNEQEHALMTARLAQEEYEELKLHTEDKIRSAVKQLEVEQLAKLQLEYCVAELEVQLAKEKAEYHAALSDQTLHAQDELTKEQEHHHQALDMLQVYQIKQKQLMSSQRRTVYNVVDQRTRRTLTRYFDKWALQKNAINAMDASMGIWIRRWSGREGIRSFCSWASFTMHRQHLRYLAGEARKRYGRRVKSWAFRSWIFGIENEKYVEHGVIAMWDRNETRLKTTCIRAWSHQSGSLLRARTLLRWATTRAEFYLKSVAFHALATNAYTEVNKQTVDDARQNYTEMTEKCAKEVQAANALASQVLSKQCVVVYTAANRMERTQKRRLCSAVWKHWLSNTKNTKRLGIVAAAVVYRSKFRKKQNHMKHWLFVAKASVRLWLEGESAVQKLHYRRRHQVLECFKAHLRQGKVERRLLAHVAWARNRKRKLDGLDAFAGQLIKKNIKTHVDTVEDDAKRKVERITHESKMREEKANRQVAQIDRELSAKVESSERRASAAEHELKKTRQMLSDTQTQLRLLEQSMGDTQGDMMEQLKTLQHERQFADNQYQETAEELRQKEVELARVESMLAQTVADGKRHTELYERSQGKIHELALEVEDLKGKTKAREMEMKSEKVDMEMMFDKQLAKAKSDHLELEEEIARLKDKISLLQEGLKAAGEATGNASGKLVNQVDELKRKCTALQDELSTTKEAATGKGTVSLRLLKAAYAAANNSYLLRGSYCKARAFHGWKRLKYHRKAAPYLIRYHRGIGRQSKKAVQNTWQNWCYEVKRMKNARGCAFAAHKQKQDEIVDVCWSAFMGLLNERKMRNDYSKAWRSTFEAMEVEKHGSMQLSSDMENLRLSLGKLIQINVCVCLWL
jgi:chromosome segregation ATPase